METKWGLQPDATVYDAAIRTLYSSSRGAEARSVFAEARARGFFIRQGETAVNLTSLTVPAARALFDSVLCAVPPSGYEASELTVVLGSDTSQVLSLEMRTMLKEFVDSNRLAEYLHVGRLILSRKALLQ
jgi:hypothetical protein